jgi:putative transposase
MKIPPIANYVEAMLKSVVNHSCLGLSDGSEGISHDAFQRVLSEKDTELVTLYEGRLNELDLGTGYWIIDDTLLEKHSDGLAGVSKLWDTKIGSYVLALNVVLLSWSDGKTKMPVAFVIQTTTEEKKESKIDSAIKLLKYAKALKLKARYVLFDSWYAAEQLLKAVRTLGWHYVTRVKKNRKFGGRQVKRYYRHPYWQAQDKLEGNIKVKLFRRGSKYFATSNTALAWKAVKKLYRIRADIEEVIKVLKQECGWESCQQRSLHTYRQHLHLGMFTYLLLLKLAKRHKTGVYVLRRRLIVGKLALSKADVQAFLSSA